MAVVRLALGNPSANTDTLLHTAVRQSVTSVIATNKSTSLATIRVWIQPSGSTQPSEYAYLTYDTAVPANNSLETFRVALEPGDKVYVRSSTADVSFSLNAIHESSGNYNKVFVQDTQPSAANIGDVWVSQALGYVKFWDGTYWINAVPGSAGYAQSTEPTYPQEGQLWVDLDDVSLTEPTYPTVSYGSSAPSGLDAGDIGAIWVNSNTGGINVWSGTSWVDTNAIVFYQSSAPASAETGQVWLDSDDNKLYVYNGSSWVLTTTPGSTYQSSAPSAPSTGQLWVDSDDKTIYVYTGSAWVQVGSTSAYQASAPSTATAGQIWMDSDTSETYMYSGSAWVLVNSGPIALNSNAITQNYSIPAGYNGVSSGPITISDGVIVTIPDGGAWSIV